MPADFLSDQERSRYQAIPADLSPQDLQHYCCLSPTDLQLIAGQRRDYNRLGFALQLITIRLLNHLPQTWHKQVPATLTAHIAAQLAIAPAVLNTYGEREATAPAARPHGAHSGHSVLSAVQTLATPDRHRPIRNMAPGAGSGTRQ